MQLGKLVASQSIQALSCKTGNHPPQDNQSLTSEKQNQQSLALAIRRTQRIKRQDINLRYEAHRRDAPRPTIRLITRLRLSELERVFEVRYGRKLSNDDAGREDLGIAIHHIVGSDVNVMRRGLAWARTWAPWMPEVEARGLIQRAIAAPKRWKAAHLGRLLNLATAERTRLKIKTIRAVDETPEAKAKRRTEQKRAWRARKRAERRTAKPEPVSRTKPWEAEGISRATWYRRKDARQPPVRQKGVTDKDISAYSSPCFVSWLDPRNLNTSAREISEGPCNEKVRGWCPMLAGPMPADQLIYYFSK